MTRKSVAIVRRRYGALLTLLSSALLFISCARIADRYTRRGDAYFSDKKYSEAIAEYNRAAPFEPDNPHLIRQLGLAHKQAGDRSDAYVLLQKAEGLQPADWEVRLTLGTMYLADARADEAKREADAVLQRAPTNLEALNLLGSAYLAKHDPEKAAEAYAKIADVTPKDPRGRYLVGVARLASGNGGEATKEFESALALSPAFYDPLAELVQMDIAGKRSDAAVARVKRQIAIVGDSAKLHDLLGLIYMQRGERARAESALVRATAIDPRFADPRVRLTQLYWDAGKYDQAFTAADEALKLDPRNLSALMVQGLVYRQKGDVAKARAAYEQALAINPRFSDAANNLAELLSETGTDQDRALRLAEAARETSPNDPRITDTLGWILYRRGEYRESASVLAEAAAKLPNEPTVAYHLGIASTKAGDTVTARAALRRALRSAANFPEREAAQKALADLK